MPTDLLLPILLVFAQTLVFAGQFVLLLVLQRRGGLIYLSLFGSVGALVGIPIAVLLLDERPPEGLAVGAVLIGLGITLLTRSGAKVSRRRTGTRSASRSRGQRSGYR